MGSNASMTCPLSTCARGVEVSHGLKRFYEPDFIIDKSLSEDMTEFILEISHGLKRFYELYLGRHVYVACIHQAEEHSSSQWLSPIMVPDDVY